MNLAAAFSLIVNRLPRLHSPLEPYSNRIEKAKGKNIRGKSLIVFFLALFSLFTLTLALPRQVHAGACDTPIDQNNPATAQQAIDIFNKCAIEKNVFDDKIFNTNQIAGTVDSLNTMLFGVSNLHPETNVATKGGGALATSARLVASLYSSPPASGVEYVAQKVRQFNPVQPAYAQAGGIGYSALQPVQRTWTVFRNIAYVGFIIVFVIMGFMIMFRAHISPQAVATVQDSIPRIVIAFVLVTFSYAIAGLMIDIMFVFLNIIINALAQANLLDNTNIGQTVFTRSIFGIVFHDWWDIVKNVASTIFHVIDEVINLPSVIDWVGKVAGFFGGSLAGLVVGIAILFIMFRVFFMLLMAYVMIIILTIAAPFFFLFQALPGRNGAGEWFKQMASQISVFPTVAMMFVFAGMLGGLGGGNAAIDAGNVGQFPLLVGGLDATIVGNLIGIGFLLMTPSAAELVRNALGVKGGPQGAAAQAGAAVLGAGAAVGGFARRRAAESAPGQAFRQISEQSGARRAERIRYAVPERFGGGARSEPPPQQVTLEPTRRRER